MNDRRLTAFCAAFLLSCVVAHDSSADAKTLNHNIRKVIVLFRQDPRAARKNMVCALIAKYAETSRDVEIVVSQKRMPWMHGDGSITDVELILTTAYLAGDIEAQLSAGKTKDDPVQATGQVIAIYRQLQSTDRKLNLLAVEKLADLQRQRKLVWYFKGD